MQWFLMQQSKTDVQPEILTYSNFICFFHILKTRVKCTTPNCIRFGILNIAFVGN